LEEEEVEVIITPKREEKKNYTLFASNQIAALKRSKSSV